MNLPLPDNDYTKAYEFFNPILNAFEEPKKVQENYTQSVKKILQNQLDEFLDYAIENNIIDQLTVGLVSKIPFQKNETLRLSQALMILKEKEHNLNKNIDSLVSRIETILINSIKDWKTIKYDKGKNLYGDYYMRFIQQTKEIITSYEHFSTLNQILLVCIGYQPKSDVLTILTNKDHAPDFNRFTIKLQSEIQYFNELKYIENKFLKTETCVPFIHELRSIQKQISEKETTLTELKTSIFHAMQKDQHKISNHMYQLIIDPKNKLMDRWRSPFTSLNAPTLIQPNLESIIQDIIKNHYKVLVYDSFSNKNNLLQALPDREREEILKTYQTFIGSKTENTNLARSYFNVVYQYLRIE
jgi:hypothetical protein